jgi:hypothetical protein
LIGAVVTFLDITERKNEEEIQKRSLARAIPGDAVTNCATRWRRF